MPWSVNIGSIAGTVICLHFTFFLFLAFFLDRRSRVRQRP
jgi:hypothetical protein